ncbi:MAG: glycosyltransferase family 9 protein [Endomicrobium sp.]|jgi:ADP-heptose:LPS heptosyltransferase|nr:glycosyltransferase family 9 protein [Endomicrobium sp.]
MKILIVKPSSFGDIVQAAPCATALKQAYPDSEITWVVFSQWEQLPLLFSDVDKVISWDRKAGVKGFFDTLKRVRQTEYDLILDLQGLFRSGLLAFLAKGKIKIGAPGMKELSGFMIKEVEPKKAKINATLRNLETVNYITDKKFTPSIRIAGFSCEPILPAAIDGEFIAFLPFARGKGKDWGVKNYLALAHLLKEKYPQYNIIVLGSKDDFGKINKDCQNPCANVIDLCGKTGIKQLAAILSKSKLSVGADTGPMHLSCALGVPSVFIFGASDINETAPHIGRFTLFLNKENPKDIEKIPPQRVFEGIERHIRNNM